jgi:Ran GTPase-activating protein (RanGAP) involved in mRNA processing and transport
MALETELFQTCRRLRNNDPTLTIVNLCQRNLDNDSAFLLSQAFQNTKAPVVVVILTGNMIRNRGAIRLAQALPESVQYLYFGKNDIRAEGAEALSQLTHLQVLDLHYNKVGCGGASHLASLLEQSCLQSLTLKGNDIQDEGFTRLAKALRSNASLQSLDLSENKCSAAVNKEFKKSFRVNTTLLTIALDSDEREQNDMQQVLDLYHLGRAFLQDTGAVIPKAAFFSRVAKEPDLLHYVLRGRPDIFIFEG